MKKEEKINELASQEITRRYAAHVLDGNDSLSQEDFTRLLTGDDLSDDEMKKIAFKAGVSFARKDRTVLSNLPEPRLGTLLKTLFLRLALRPYEMSEEDKQFYLNSRERLEFRMTLYSLLATGLTGAVALIYFFSKRSKVN